MRPESRPLVITINVPVLADEAVVQIHDFLYHLIDLFEANYGHQIRRFHEDHSYDNLVLPDQHRLQEDPPF